MLNIIPAIDIIDGQCVRLTQGDYAQKTVYSSDPVAIAKDFEKAGFKRLHVVDLDGAKAKHIVNEEVLRQIALKTDLTIDFGGGIKSKDDIKKALDAGASQVTVGTVAAQEPLQFLEWLGHYGSDKLILGADVIDGNIATHGWQKTSAYSLLDFLELYIEKGVQYVICTDVSKDGKLEGTAVTLYQQIRQKFPDLHLIASGGVTSLDDLHRLEDIGCYGAIIGKALYEGTLTNEELQRFLG